MLNRSGRNVNCSSGIEHMVNGRRGIRRKKLRNEKDGNWSRDGRKAIRSRYTEKYVQLEM